jgi:hypothetical protein
MADFENIQLYLHICKCNLWIQKQDIEQFRCRTLYFNCYLDRILLLSNWICPKARDLIIESNSKQPIRMLRSRKVQNTGPCLQAHYSSLGPACMWASDESMTWPLQTPFTHSSCVTSLKVIGTFGVRLCTYQCNLCGGQGRAYPGEFDIFELPGVKFPHMETKSRTKQTNFHWGGRSIPIH